MWCVPIDDLHITEVGTYCATGEINLVAYDPYWYDNEILSAHSDSKTVTVGKSEEMGCKVNTIEEKIVDKVPCELGEETKDDVTYYYVDSESDLYRLSDDVNNGTDYKGKIIK